MKTIKETYEKPFAKTLVFEFQGIVCQSMEPINPGDEHEWEYYEED